MGQVDRHLLLNFRLMLVAAIGIGLAGLIGLSLDIVALRDFGIARHPLRALAAISYVAIAVSLLLPLRPTAGVAEALLAIPVVIVGLGMFGIAIPLPLPGGGRATVLMPPYLQTLACIAMLTVAVAFARRTGRVFNRTAAVLASVTLGVSVMTAIIVLFRITPSASELDDFFPSLPATLQAIAISGAVLAWGGWPSWADIPGRGQQQTRIIQRAFPIIILVPAVNALIEVVADESRVFSPLVVDILAAGVNIAILATLVFWSLARLSAEHAALWETTNAMESAPIVLTSAAGEIRHWSRGCEELFGWTAEEVVGRQKSDVLQSRDADTPDLAPDIEQQREMVELHRDGTPVHVLERARLVQAEGREPVLVYKMTDISERVEIEAALKESDANLLLALNAQQIGTFDWDMVTGNVVVSAGLEQRLGVQAGDLEHVSGWSTRIEPSDWAAVSATIDAAAAVRAERCDFRYRISVPNGGVRTLEGSGRLLYDADGGLARIVGVNVDVTDRDEREAALLAEQEQLRLVLKTVPSAMVIFDRQGTIKAFSASAERMFGYTAEEAIGRNVEILAVSPEIHRANSFIDRYLAGGTSHVTDGTPVTYAGRRGGGVVPINLWMGDMQIGNERLFTGFAEDLTERLRSDRRMAKMRDELLHASRLSTMGEMAAGLAHELNQPLAAAAYFLGAADLILADEGNREQGRSLLRLGGEQALRAGEIIRRMRDFATRGSIDMQVAQIRTILDDAVSLTFVGNARYDIQIVYDVDPAAEAVLADRVQIGQVFVNLLRNATEELRKCPPDDRRITISTRDHDAEMIEVSVADSGPGLDPKMLGQLYMPFVSTKNDKGMGVGLSICRRIIEAHGGVFDAVNGADGGAIFRFTLPKIPATLETPE